MSKASLSYIVRGEDDDGEFYVNDDGCEIVLSGEDGDGKPWEIYINPAQARLLAPILLKLAEELEPEKGGGGVS